MESITAWFEDAPIDDYERVAQLLPALEGLAETAVDDRDRSAIESGERARALWWARVERANGDYLPDRWKMALEAADHILARSLDETAPIAAMQTLDEIAVDIMFVFRDSPTLELTTEEILASVLYGDCDQVDYRGYLDRLAANALLGVRWRPDHQDWRLSPLGHRTLAAIRDEVEHFLRRIRAGVLDRPEWESRIAGNRVYSARTGTSYEMPENLRAVIPGWSAAEDPAKDDGWVIASVPDAELFAARYYTCRFVSDSVGHCRHDAMTAQQDSAMSFTYVADPTSQRQSSPTTS